MATQLDVFRDHCAKMSQADHKPECPMLTWTAPYWSMWTVRYDQAGIPSSMAWNGPPPKFKRPECDGCNSPADKALFARLAAEVDAYQDSPLFA